MSIMVERQNWPVSAISGESFPPLVADIGPQASQLAAADAIVGQQHGFDGLGLLRGRTEPIEKGVFFVARRAAHAANPATFGNLRQGF